MYSPFQIDLHKTKMVISPTKNSHLEQRLEGAYLRKFFQEQYHNQFNKFLCQLGEITMDTKIFDNS